MKITIESLNEIFRGKEVDKCKLASLFSGNHDGEYIAYCTQDIPHEPFGITPSLFESWEYRGIDYNVYLYIKEGDVEYIDIHKLTEDGELTPSQQELRIARRVIEAVVKESQ